MSTLDYHWQEEYRTVKKCNEDDVTKFRSQVDYHFNNTKKKIYDHFNEEKRKDELSNQMKKLNKPENNKEKCPFLKIAIKKKNDQTILSLLIKKEFRDEVEKSRQDIYNDDGYPCDFVTNEATESYDITNSKYIEDDEYIEKKVEELNGYYRGLVTTLYLTRVVDINKRNEVVEDDAIASIIFNDSNFNDRNIYYLELPKDNQKQARETNESLIIRDDDDINKGYYQSRGFLQLGIFNRQKYEEKNTEQLLTYFKNYCVEPYWNYDLDSMNNREILINLWRVKSVPLQEPSNGGKRQTMRNKKIQRKRRTVKRAKMQKTKRHKRVNRRHSKKYKR